MAFNYSPKVVTDGLVMYLDAGNNRSYVSGSTSWLDLSRAQNNGSLVNGSTFNSANGGSIVFDGVNDYANISKNIIIASDFTIDFWFYLTNTPTTYITLLYGQTYFEIRFGDSGFSNRLQFAVNSATIAGNYSPNLNKTTALNNWKSVIWTRQSGINIIYLNSIQQNLAQGTSPTYNLASFTDNTSVTFPSSTVISSPGQPFPGRISSFKIYNKALSAQEVLQNYNALKGRFNL